jgi:site-specific DNA-methyltransferase (adenine-specific)
MINLMQGDCLERMKEIESGSVDMILTDPPYGTTACKWDSIIPLEPMWEQLKRIVKPNGAIVMTASQPFTTTLIASNMEWFRYNWVWSKTVASNFAMSRKQPLKKHEDVCVFYQKQPTYNPQMEHGKPYKDNRCSGLRNASVGTKYGVKRIPISNAGTRYPSSVQRLSNGNNKNVHPTQKPVALMEYLIKTYTNEGETVLDFTMGSGTTGVAAKNLNRKFIGIELDEGYFNIAKERINNA